MDMALKLNREILRHAVSKQIQCQISGRVLDVRTAVMVEVTMKDGRTISQVYHADEVEDLDQRIAKVKILPNVKGVVVYDGRILYARKAAAARVQATA